MTQLYRMLDDPAASKAAIPVATADEARTWNTPEKGFGIFMTVNSFRGPRRKENLIAINAWCVDMDVGTKAEMAARLHASPLIPTAIIETKRGYQAYWAARDAKPEHWNAIVLERLVPAFGADKNARDLCRIMRAPGFLHLKDPSTPFKCSTVWQRKIFYTERQMGEAFRWVPDPKTQRETHEASRPARSESPTTGETFWDAVYNLDQEEGLRRLSGHWAVGGEQYTFRRCSNGNLNIYVDGKGSSCFIDGNRRIGSSDGGGPTIAQWLRYFKHDWKVVVQVLKETHPQLAVIDDAQRAQRRAA